MSDPNICGTNHALAHLSAATPMRAATERGEGMSFNSAKKSAVDFYARFQDLIPAKSVSNFWKERTKKTIPAKTLQRGAMKRVNKRVRSLFMAPEVATVGETVDETEESETTNETEDDEPTPFLQATPNPKDNKKLKSRVDHSTPAWIRASGSPPQSNATEQDPANHESPTQSNDPERDPADHLVDNFLDHNESMEHTPGSDEPGSHWASESPPQSNDTEQDPTNHLMDNFPEHNESMEHTPGSECPVSHSGDPCVGVRRGVDESLRSFTVKNLRAAASELDGNDINYMSDQLKEAHPNDSMLDTFGISGVKTCVEDNVLVIRSRECDTEADPEHAKSRFCENRCRACQLEQQTISKKISKSANAPKDQPVHSKTNTQFIAGTPKLAEQEMRKSRDEIRRLKRENMKLALKNEMKHAGVFIDDPKKVDAMHLALTTAKDVVVKTEDVDEDSCDFLQVHYDHVHKNQEHFKRGGKKDSGIRHHPVLTNFAMSLLAKTSHAVHRTVAMAMGLPALRTVLDRQQKTTGKQNDPSNYGIRVEVIESLSDQLTKLGHAAGSNGRMGSLSFDSMKVRPGLDYDIITSCHVGLDTHVRFNVMEHTIKDLAKKAANSEGAESDASMEEGKRATFLDQADNIAQHHLVFKWTSAHPDVELSLTVAALNITECTPTLINNTIHSLLVALEIEDVGVCILVGDGAGENTKVFAAMSTHPISDYIPSDLRESFKDVPFDLGAVFLHPCSGLPIFVLEDMPHVVKRLVNALERSSNPQAERNLWWGATEDQPAQPLNLGMIRQVWEAVGGRTLRLQEGKLSMAHFIKTANSRMRVYLSVQVVSSSVARMVEKAIADDEIDLKLDRKQCRRLIELAWRVDRLVDVINGRSRSEASSYKADFEPSTGEDIQKKLLTIITWFAEWEESVDSSSSFLADQTWVGLQRMILGHVGVIQCYVLDNDFVIAPRRTTSDPCEHHFSNLHSNFGSTNSGTARMCDAANARAD